jgi:anti-sigma factor RsiW
MDGGRPKTEGEENMNCGEVKVLIQLYMDSELDARSTLEAQRHLESCASCSRLLDALEEQDRLLKEAARAAAPPSARVRARVLDAIRDESSAAPTRWWRLPSWRRVAAVAALLLITTLAALRGGWAPGVNEKVYAAVALDHAAHCSADMMMGATTDPEELNRLAASYGHVRAIPDLLAFGYGDPRGRVCKINEVEFLHLTYYHPTERPLSIFLRPHASDGIGEKLTALNQDRFSVVSISSSVTDLFVVSSFDERRTAAIADAVAKQLS